MKKAFAILLYVTTALISCKENPGYGSQVSWLEGTWVNRTSRGNIYEEWIRASGSEWQGASYMIRGMDTVIFEEIRIVAARDSLFYIPAVNDQNQGKAVTFTMTSISDSLLVFMNPAHDFPQVISYRRHGQDSLVASISGIVDAIEKARYFPMKRVAK